MPATKRSAPPNMAACKENLMDGQSSFGCWLRWRRRLLDLSRETLAQRVGCAVVTIRKLESDERRPSMQIAARLADCLNIAPEERTQFITYARAEPYVDHASPPPPTSGLPERPPVRQFSNLLIPLTRLIGRKQDVAALRNRLLRADERLLTLIGPPGIGKTRLALQVATDLLAVFSDGVCFVALAAISDPALVAATIAQALDVTETKEQPFAARLADYLHAKRMLLVLDNFEQVVAAATVVVDLLEACPLLKVLVTSRAPLHVRGERLVPVPPLLVPNLTRLPGVAALGRTPAVRLFMERVQAVVTDFIMTETNAPTVAAICARLEGLPLAIELVAARSRLLPPTALLARIDKQLTLLTDGPCDLPARHQTLRSAIAWSYDLLPAGEQTLFRRLGVFVGGCTLEAATAVVGSEVRVLSWEPDNAALKTHSSELDTLDGLASLVNQSLLEQAAGDDGEPRFTMLETIREYARERLAANGEDTALRRRHAAYFLALAEQSESELRGPRQRAWLERLEIEHNNVRAALEAVLAGMDTAIGVRFTSAFWWFWNVRGHFSEGRGWLDRALAQDGDTLTAVRAWALHGAGVLAWNQGDYVTARAFHDASLAIGRSIGDQRIIGHALRAIGNLEESLSLFRILGDPWGTALTLIDLAELACDRGEFAEARSMGEESLALCRKIGDIRSQAWALWDLAFVGCQQGDYPWATTCVEESLALCRELGDHQGISRALMQMGIIACAQGDFDRATSLLDESVAILRQLGANVYLGWPLYKLGDVALRQGDTRRAVVCLRESLEHFQAFKSREGIACYLGTMAGVAVMQEHPARAVRLFGAAQAMLDKIGFQVGKVDRADIDRDIAVARAQLDVATFAAAWAAGRALSLDQAVAEALGEGE
jgi:predicted ATPase/DNA-binding XRE family transcriptional regulator